MTSTPEYVLEDAAETRPRSRAFLLLTLGGGLVLLSGWWSIAGSAAAESYPPALGCAVSGFASAGSGLLQVHGTGFGAGAQVLVGIDGIDGRHTGAVRADAAGSFRAAWPAGALVAGAPVTAADAGCSATGALVIENQQAGSGGSEPAPPARRADPPAAAIPSIPLTGLPPQLFLGMAGAVLLAGAALTGLTGRLGHRSERPARPEISVAGTLPTTPGTA